jgi:hypothetical protein
MNAAFTVPDIVLPPVPGHPNGLVLEIEFIDESYDVQLDSDGITQLREDEFDFEEHLVRRDWGLRGYVARFFYVAATNAIVEVVTVADAERKDVATVLDAALAIHWRQWWEMQPAGRLQ